MPGNVVNVVVGAPADDAGRLGKAGIRSWSEEEYARALERSGILACLRGEQSREQLAAALPDAVPWYHGGVAGLLPGDFILPPGNTGATVLIPTDLGVAWVTGKLDVAGLFAAGCGGDVYQVRPSGLKLPGRPERALAELACDRAEILAVLPGPLQATGRYEGWAPAPALVHRQADSR